MNGMRVVMGLLAGAILLAGGGVHLATYAGEAQVPGLLFGLLHMGSIAVLGACSVFVARSREWKLNELAQVWKLTLRDGWARILMGALLLYAVGNFAMNIGPGQFQVKDGKYVETQKGTVVRTFATQKAFVKARSQGERQVLRAFSGHWLAFGGLSLLLIFQLPSIPLGSKEEEGPSSS